MKLKKLNKSKLQQIKKQHKILVANIKKHQKQLYPQKPKISPFQRICFFIAYFLGFLYLLSRCVTNVKHPELNISLTPEPTKAGSHRTPIPPKPTQERSKFQPPPERPLPWLEILQNQVAARNQRLSACIPKENQNLMIRWTFQFNPRSGVTSGHLLEPILEGNPLPEQQNKCITRVLEAPPYSLGPLALKSGMDSVRLSFVLEF